MQRDTPLSDMPLLPALSLRHARVHEDTYAVHSILEFEARNSTLDTRRLTIRFSVNIGNRGQMLLRTVRCVLAAR